MAISSSLATKVGAASTVTAGVGLGGTYLAWDHITLYAVEREVINKDLKLTAVNKSDDNKKITVEAPKSSTAIEGTSSELGKEQSWICEVTIKPESGDTTSYVNLGKYIQSNLQGQNLGLDETQKRNKKLLVKACAKNRTGNDKSVKGLLSLIPSNSNSSKFTFEEHPYLDVLLEHDLFEVEKEAIDKGVTVTVGDPADAKITITASSNTGSGSSSEDKLSNGHSWSCEITVDPKGNSNNENVTAVKGKLSSKFPASSKLENHKDLITLLIKACAKNRVGGASNTTVKGQLSVKANTTGTPTTYSVENNPELNELVK